eukprot:3291809-Rhodomonas_salina.1
MPGLREITTQRERMSRTQRNNNSEGAHVRASSCCCSSEENTTTIRSKIAILTIALASTLVGYDCDEVKSSKAVQCTRGTAVATGSFPTSTTVQSPYPPTTIPYPGTANLCAL